MPPKTKEPKKAKEVKVRKETTEAQRAQVITFREVGLSYAKIAERTGIPKTTCFDIVKRDQEHRKEGELTPYTASAPRSGRPEKLTRREKRHLISIAKRERRVSLGILTRSITTKVCMKTARKVLANAGLRRRRAKRKPYISPLQKLKRFLWCKERRNWTLDDWRRVIWTDESRFEVGFVGGTVWVWRDVDEKDLPSCLLPTFKSGRSSVMIWGSIAYGKKGPMVILPGESMNGPNYCKWVVRPVLGPFYKELEKEIGETIVMEDGAPSHRAKYTQAVKKRLKIQTMPWPPQSPDLNPIENLWRIMKARINKRQPPVSTKAHLTKALQEEWDLFTPADFDGLIASMMKRVKECIKNRGGSTHY